MNKSEKVIDRIHTLGDTLETGDSKNIFIDSRTNRLWFATIVKGESKQITWKEWKNSSLPDESTDNLKQRFVNSLMSMIKQFKFRVEANSSIRGKSFIEQVDTIIKIGRVKMPSSGVVAL